MGLPRQEYWSGLPFPFPRGLPNSKTKPVSPAVQVDCLPLSHLGSPTWENNYIFFLNEWAVTLWVAVPQILVNIMKSLWMSGRGEEGGLKNSDQTSGSDVASSQACRQGMQDHTSLLQEEDTFPHLFPWGSLAARSPTPAPTQPSLFPFPEQVIGSWFANCVYLWNRRLSVTRIRMV